MSGSTLERAGVLVAGVLLLIVLASATLIDRTPPTVDSITVDRTLGGAHTALTHTAIDVVFSEAVDEATAAAHFRLQPAVDGSFSWTDARSMIFTPRHKLALATGYTAWEEPGFADIAGNVQRQSSAMFTFRTVGPPSLVATVPADGAADVSLEDPLRLTFDRLMDTQLTAAAVSLEPAAPFDVSWREETLTLTPTAPLQPDTEYQLSVGSTAADTDGNSPSTALTVRFRTVAVGIEITSVYPADHSAGAPLNGPIAVVFDAPVDPASAVGSIVLTPPVTGQTMLVALPDDRTPAPPAGPVASPSPAATPGPGGTPSSRASPSSGATAGTGGGGSASPFATGAPTASPGAPTPSPTPGGGLRTLVFVPAAPLAPNTTYTVQLRAGVVRGSASTAATAGLTWTFTTGNTTTSLQNQIVFRAARGGVANVWTMNPDGTNARQVTGELVPVTSFDVSGDGRFLVYAAGGLVRREDPATGDITTLTDAAHADYAPRLLPDGSGVIVGRRDRATGRDLGWWLLPFSDPVGGARQLLPDGAPPLGSVGLTAAVPGGDTGAPGTWAAVGAVAGNGSAALLPTGTGRLVLVGLARPYPVTPTGLIAPDGPASWSAMVDGGAFVVAAHQEATGVASIWRVTSAGVVVAGPPTTPWSAAGPDGALVSLESGRLIYRPSMDDLPVALTPGGELLDRQPSFGPADAIVFVRVTATAPLASDGIWVIEPDGSGLRELTRDGSDPRWLP